MSYTHFWERIDAFFKLKIPKEIVKNLLKFYSIGEEGANKVQEEIGQFTNLNYLDDPQVRDGIKLSKEII